MKLQNLSTTKPEAATGKYGDVTGTIKRELAKIKAGEATRVKDIVSILITEHKLPKNQAYVRINNVCKRAWFALLYKKAYDGEGGTWIGRKEKDKEPKDKTEALS